ncbi:hypothetical protein ACFLV0_05660 [Chloroflexota bacterium]
MAEARNPLSFAAESFLWMMTSEAKDGGQRLLSADEEQSMGQKLASRIQALAKEQLLFQKFPKDAALFFYIWSHYGSPDETDHHLTRSFQSKPENAIAFLKCYLNVPWGLESGLASQNEFSRIQYDLVAKAIDPSQCVRTEARASFLALFIGIFDGSNPKYSLSKTG